MKTLDMYLVWTSWLFSSRHSCGTVGTHLGHKIGNSQLQLGHSWDIKLLGAQLRHSEQSELLNVPLLCLDWATARFPRLCLNCAPTVPQITLCPSCASTETERFNFVPLLCLYCALIFYV